MKKLKTPQDVQRRNFLKTVASSGIAVNTLKASALGMGIMASRTAAAAGPGGLKRVIFVYTPDGAPNGTYTLNNGTLGENAVGLEAVKDNCIIFDDCTTGGNGHSDGGLGILGGAGTPPAGQEFRIDTYDVHLEKYLGAASVIPSLHLGVESNSENCIGFRSKNRIKYQDNPIAAFTGMFGAGGEAVDPASIARKKAPFESSLAEIRAIKAKLSASEVLRMEEHEEAIERMIANFDQGTTAGCDDISQFKYGLDGTEIGEFAKISKMQCQNIVDAFKCDLTNVATLHLGNHSAEFTISADPELAALGTYHTAVHFPDTIGYGAYRRFFTERLAELIALLKTTKGSDDEFLIESTLVLQITCMGNGNAHDQAQAPFTLVSGSTQMVGGRGFNAGHSYNLLDTVSAALGVDDQMPKYASIGTGDGGGVVSGLLTAV
ncbi:MAG: DUF1552 domain-containing protein [Saccharospirillaceae bacterium]|nr:DUF1552 domain-containing protein [Pseudomonadales bacterium]NRB78756.1 DUF1552 domain-containing protein [Saccharospirillaceae bacterium]